jgi:hypothetical protein
MAPYFAFHVSSLLQLLEMHEVSFRDQALLCPAPPRVVQAPPIIVQLFNIHDGPMTTINVLANFYTLDMLAHILFDADPKWAELVPKRRPETLEATQNELRPELLRLKSECDAALKELYCVPEPSYLAVLNAWEWYIYQLLGLFARANGTKATAPRGVFERTTMSISESVPTTRREADYRAGLELRCVEYAGMQAAIQLELDLAAMRV